MLQVRHLEKTIHHRSALYIEQLDIAAGEVVAIIGPAFSGKTLLLHLLAGLLVPSRGSVTLDEQDIYQVPALRRKIGILFTDDLLYERFSGLQNLEIYRQLYNRPKLSITEALSQVGLSDQAELNITKLSAAAQRRLAFARLLLARPSVYLLDQPSLRTDLDTQILWVQLIKQLADDGAAIVIAEHDLSWAGKCCTRVIELDNGRISGEFTPETSGEGAIAPERHIPYKIPARKEDRVILFDPGDILYATSRDGKTWLRTVDEEAVTSLTLQELETRLAGRGFFKAHRAYLVNLQHIKAVIQYTRNSYTLLLKDSQETMVPLSKQCEKELQNLLGY